MYKTVRHGENSLQYTILPQQDDGGSGNTTRSRPSRGGLCRRRRTCFAIIGTVFLACSLVAATVLIPVLASHNITTTQWTQHQRVPGHHVVALVEHRPHSTFATRPTTEPTTTTTTITSTLEATTMEATTPLIPSTEPPPHPPPPPPPPPSTLIPSTEVETTTEATTEVISSTVTPLPNTRASTLSHVTTIQTTVSPKMSWLLDFSFVDWMGSGGKDSLLLAGLLVVGLLVAVLGAALACTIARRRRDARRRHLDIGNMTSDLQSTDKTTLLPDCSDEE